LKSLTATALRFLARTRLATAKTVVPFVVAGLILLCSGLVMAAPPEADFGFVPDVASPGDPVTFTADVEDADGDVISIEWDFEDDGTFDDAGAEVQHTYGSPGVRTVRMVVTDAASETDSATHQIRVNAGPDAAFGFDPSTPSAGEQIDFDASASSDDAALANGSFDWDLDGDGDYDDDTGREISHSYATPGTRTVGLRVTDSEGETDTASHSVTVSAANGPPQAAFDFTPARPNPGQVVAFDGSDSSDDGLLLPTAYAWDLDGDGQYDDALGVTPTFSYSSGTRTVGLRVTDVLGLSDTASETLTVNAPPFAAFEFSPSAAETGETVEFDASGSSDDAGLSDGSYAWDFQNDGSYDETGEQVDHAYASAGTMTVRLRVTDAGGLATTTTHTIQVSAPNSPPQPSFTVGDTRPNIGQAVSFNASATTDDEPLAESAFGWDFDNDGDIEATGRVAQGSFASAGTKTVRLRVTDSDGAAADTTRTLTVNPPPAAAFDFSPTNPDVGDTVSFDATDSSDDQALPAGSYAWDLDNDGAFDDAVGATAATAFASAGTRTVRLQVTDADGATDVASESVSVASNPAPTAAFTSSPARPNPAAAVTFSAAGSSDDEPIPAGGYAWDFDNDGAFDDGTGASVSHTFATAGAKTVRLQVTDADGATAVATGTVTVNAPPTGDFTFTPATPLLNQSVSFSATGNDDVALPAAPYAWDLDNDGAFDDGTNATASFTFGTAGTKTVRLRITDSGSLQTIVTKTVTVNRAPVADFTVAPLTPRLRETVTFTNTSRDPDGDATITARAWDLDNDGQFDDGTGPTATTSYTTTGTKTVRLQVTDNGGATNVRTRTFPVQAVAPNAAFSFSPARPVPGQTVTFTSSSTPSAGSSISSQAWDFNGDSVIDATGPTAKTVYPTAGPRTVTLTVTDDQGFDIATAAVAVNAPPVAAIRFAPAQPYAGDTVDLVSVSSGVDDALSAEAWDLDGDGQFDDATGKVARRTLATVGAHTVRLRVVDAGGAASIGAVTIIARARPVATPPIQVLSPTVRISARGGLIRSLSVVAPRGSMVKARCFGKGCPARKATSTRSKGKKLRIRWLERRLRAGTRITISVTARGKVGSYTAFVVRRGKLPKRSDLCLRPAAKKPSRCPA
jgi:PKD repeat protein